MGGKYRSIIILYSVFPGITGWISYPKVNHPAVFKHILAEI